MSRAVLWDLDGTLVDSAEYHWLAWQHTVRREGIELAYDRFLATFGQKNDRILRGWLGDDLSAERIRSIGDAKEAEYRRLAEAGRLVPLPGAAEWVARLHAAGWKQAVASSAPRLNVELVMRVLHMEPYLEDWVRDMPRTPATAGADTAALARKDLVLELLRAPEDRP